MTEIIRHGRPEAVNQQASHTLFVEGKDQDAFDPTVLGELFKKEIPALSIRPLGPSHWIRAAADALHRHHPDYYFLVDRDHFTAEQVEKTWERFPDEDFSNLLIWRRREIENYFLDPAYLENSIHMKKPKVLRRVIEQEAKSRVFLDAANLVLVRLRERQKENWISLFDSPRGFADRATALNTLMALTALAQRPVDVASDLRQEAVEKAFQETCDDLLGGKPHPSIGCGSWLMLMRGKALLPPVVSRCFQVKDRADQTLQGSDALREVVKDLLRRPLTTQPDDFQTLHRLLKDRVHAR